uniref:C4-dicarboxylate-binding protein DctP n=1 Tax=Candidatus Kentrum sp. FW TaxID=2126338 RepID=A0A450SWB7_9GAMM|nr:MAG: C4-dicarboxylate-binding protein DctP [Candidatus Kentron sp. FW]
MRTIITVLFAVFYTFFASMAYGEPVVIKFSHVVDSDTPKGKMADRFKELVEKKMSDKVRIEVYPDSQLADDRDVADKILAGEIQMAAPALSKLKELSPKIGLFDMPFLFNGIGAVDKFKKTKEGKALLRSMEKKGIIGLGYMHNGMKHFSANERIISPSDAKGLKFRIMSSAVLTAQFEALGAIPVEKPFKDVYDSLKSGELDGQENTWSNIYSKRFHEVQEYITESSHGYLGYMVITGTDFWNSLEPAVRKELGKLLSEAIGFGNQEAVQKDILDKNRVVTAGKAEIFTLNEKDRKKWIKVMKPVWHKFDDVIGKDLIDMAETLN